MLAAGVVLSLERIMRTSSLTIAAALAVTCMATSLQGQKAAPPIDARSLQLTTQARAARSAGNLDGAADLLETALAVDPRNEVALVTLGEVATARGLPGSAVRYYREALLLDPADTAALRGQGEALVDKGAVHLAEANLARIKALCKAAACPDAAPLAAAIAKGPPVATAQVVTPTATHPR
jgi:Tfp pilus assembly protein PilF